MMIKFQNCKKFINFLNFRDLIINKVFYFLLMRSRSRNRGMASKSVNDLEGRKPLILPAIHKKRYDMYDELSISP